MSDVAFETLLILGMFLVTFSVRYALFAVAGHFSFPQWAQDALSFVPPAVLTAIIVPGVLMPKGALWFSPDNPWLMAGGLAIAVGLWRQNLLLTITLSIGAFLILRFAQSSL